MNCNGCHANGGGGMGPALTDARWRYGGSMNDIVKTILNGRPNGMPAFRNRITEDQAWELASYVRSLSSRTRKDILAGRADQPANIPPPSLNEPRGVIRVTPEEDVERRP
ncbi:MAG: c-type cytochrome [Novosphingobium sp.]|nr:c-type cytochrome [Novosphingobium sp.]